ncbi:zinc finger CCCH domain-containing protein 18-like [Impatiens glandulifera]|uniref:zinc finger CCCH domain-containing protein 18-like n=1 Tax=Impatiens glandulifera TaxID=253017 RepID=UPI001FB15AEB|nr:zinc finger CCCH domain-containing protein 18-like [Impatiens glandulifera]
MDSLEASSIVYSKIREIEPHNVAKKIIGVLLLEDRGQEMIRLAYGPDHYIHTLVDEIKIRHGLNSTQMVSPHPWDLQMTRWEMNTPNFLPPPIDVHHNQNQELLNLEGVSREYLPYHYLNSRQRLGERQVKVCQYFMKGYCRNGINCRYIHNHLYPQSDHELVGDMFLPGSIRRLESDIYELLKSIGEPVSIASLPSLYQEKFGRHLQAEGYLTESQRHGKAGYNLTKLLARLKCIRIIDRPHGQHAVTLVEDGFNNIRERNDPGPIVTGSRQIYLTFPAESTFTEEDVSDYFSNYGTVQDVRIPWQEQRMFGFVNFSSAETVQMVLNMSNPHVVCGARVLVKAYREKPNATYRNYQENTELASYIYSDLYPSNWSAAQMLSRQMKEQRKTFDIVKRLDRLCIGQIPIGRPNFEYATIEDQNPIVDEAGHPELSERQFNYLVNDLSNGLTNQDHPNLHEINYIGSDSQRNGLPDSPF